MSALIILPAEEVQAMLREVVREELSARGSLAGLLGDNYFSRPATITFPDLE